MRRWRCCMLCVDVVYEDSGNYTCEVRGPESTVLHNVTHYVYVRSNWHAHAHTHHQSCAIFAILPLSHCMWLLVTLTSFNKQLGSKAIDAFRIMYTHIVVSSHTCDFLFVSHCNSLSCTVSETSAFIYQSFKRSSDTYVHARCLGFGLAITSIFIRNKNVANCLWFTLYDCTLRLTKKTHKTYFKCLLSLKHSCQKLLKSNEAKSSYSWK